MLTEIRRPKRGPKPQGFVDLKAAITPELNTMLDRLALSTGLSKSALTREALARYGEALGYLAEGTAEALTPTRTRRPGSSSN